MKRLALALTAFVMAAPAANAVELSVPMLFTKTQHSLGLAAGIGLTPKGEPVTFLIMPQWTRWQGDRPAVLGAPCYRGLNLTCPSCSRDEWGITLGIVIRPQPKPKAQ